MAKKSLVAAAKQLQRPRRKTWLDNLDEETRAEVRDVKRAYRSGEIDAGPRAIYEFLCESVHITCSYETFRLWLSGRGPE